LDNERETLSLLSWNINGWYENTKHIRANIITGLNPDIAVVVIVKEEISFISNILIIRT